MAEKQIFREKSLERISSPEQLNDYLKVTKPAVWAVLAAVILFLVGLMVWSNFTYIGSFAEGTAIVKDGTMTVHFDDPVSAGNVKEGMDVIVQKTANLIVKVGMDQNEQIIAMASTDLDDGIYKASVEYRQTQVFSLLFNN